MEMIPLTMQSTGEKKRERGFPVASGWQEALVVLEQLCCNPRAASTIPYYLHVGLAQELEESEGQQLHL